jgi:small subunit ribosomal protein S7
MVAMKIFGLYDASDVRVEDPGLKRVINLSPKLTLKSHGRIKWDPTKSKVNVIERLINLLQVPGSRGKKHKIITSWMTGKQSKATKIVLDAFKIIEEQTKENPIKVFVKAIENGSPRDEVTSIEYGGARYPQAVDVAPRRRLNLVLRFFVQGSYDKAFNKKATITASLAKELILASQNSSESYAVNKRNEIEKQADAAR